MFQFPYLAIVSVIIYSVTIDLSTSENSGNNMGCFYKGEYYTSNWTDGCDFNCTCIKPKTGYYKCTTRCPIYRDIPTGCVLHLPPGEECCKQPDCRALTSYHSNTNDGDNSDKNSTTTDGSGPADNVTENEGTKGCQYKGQYYHSNWTDGCELKCTCNDVVSGLYKCTKRCKEYSDLNPGCELMLPPNEECCPEPVCNSTDTHSTDDGTTQEVQSQDKANEQTTPKEQEIMVSYETATVPGFTVTTNTAKETQRLAVIFSKFGPVNLFSVKKSSGNESTTTERKPAHTHKTLRPGLDYNPTSTENKGTVHQVLAFGLGGFCSYKGLNFTKNERWFDGCKYMCTCLNAKLGVYKCIDRCPNYNALPVGCVKRRSMTDACCLEPDCRNGTVVRREKLHNPDWITSTLQRLKLPPMSTLKQMFNKRMELKKLGMRADRHRHPTLTRDIPIHTKSDLLSNNITNNIVKKVVNEHNLPKFNFDRILTAKKSGRYSDITPNIQPIARNTKRFTDYSKPELSVGNGVMNSNTVNNDSVKTSAKNSEYVSTDKVNGVLLNTDTMNSNELKTDSAKTSVVKHASVDTDALKSNVLSTNTDMLSRLISIIDKKIKYVSQTTVAPNISSTTSKDIYTDIKSPNDSDKHNSTNTNTSEDMIDTSMNNAEVVMIDNSNQEKIDTKSSHASTTETVMKSFDEHPTNIQSMTTNSTTIANTTDSIDKEVIGKVSLVKLETASQSMGNPDSSLLLRLLKFKQVTTAKPKSKKTPVYRTLRTSTGIFRVSSVDGTITPLRKPIVGVLSRMLQSARKRSTFKKESRTTKGVCQYKGHFYTIGELWFDKCEYVCKCNGAGQYTCHERCPGHEYIPSGCSMLKPNIEACCDILVCKNTQNTNNTQSYRQDYNGG